MPRIRTISRILPLLGLLLAVLVLPAAVSAMGGKPQEGSAPKQEAAALKQEGAPKQEAAPQKQAAKPEATRGALQVKPEYATSGGRGIIRLSFSAPMVDKAGDLIGKALSAEDTPFTVAPDLPGEGRWLDEATFVFQTYERMPNATTLTLTPRGAVKSLSGAAYEGKGFSFTPYPFRFQAAQTRYAADGAVTLEISFSAKVDFAKLKAALRITDGKDAELPVELTPLKGEAQVTKVQARFTPEQLGNLFVRLPEGFVSEEGPVGLAAARGTVKVEGTSMLAVRTVRARQSDSPPWERYIEVATSNAADMDTVRQYLDITPETKVDIVARSNGFLITGDFIARPRVSLTFKKGMPGLAGLLAEDFSATVAFDDFSPNMAFETTGTILSPNRSMRVPLSTINVDKIQATLWQLPENNIPLMATGFFDSYKKHLSRKIAVREGTLNATRNTPFESSIDLTEITGKAKGVFLLTLFDASDPQKNRNDDVSNPLGSDYDEYYYEDGIASPIEKLVVVSDIGITARVMPDSVTVWANAITTAESLRNARVRLFAANGVLLAEGRTDKDGLWRHERAQPWLGRERPAIVVVSTTAKEGPAKAEQGLAEASVTDTAFLRFDTNLSADSAFDTGGREYVSKGYEAYCFTSRGVFRPGETADVKILVRDAMLRVPEKFPVAWRVTASTGRVVGSGTAMLSENGGASISFPIVPSAPTGRYSVAVSLPGQEDKPFGYGAFAVEEFQPPRIEVALTPEQPFTTGQTPVSIDLDAKYLFGAPVAGAPWESAVSIEARDFSHPDWRAFTFPSVFPKNEPQIVTDNGALDGNGKTTLTVTPDETWNAPSLAVTATVRVREDGGRWVARNITVPHYTAPVLLGFERPGKSGLAGTPFSLRVAAVTPEGKAANLASAKAEITRREEYYVRTDSGYTRSVRYAPVAEMPVTLENGLGVVTFTPAQRGEYRVSLTDDTGAAAMRAEVSVVSDVAGTEDGASSLVDRVMLSWDRPRYAVGETAALKVRSPFPGKLLVTLEADREIFRMVLPLKEVETTVHVPVLAAMTPNAYCSAWVIRPVRDGDAWGAHRAYGVVPLLLERSQQRLNVALTAPDSALPKTELPVAITVTDAMGQPVRGEVTLALVDEGLLSLTNHKTPDPFDFFTAKRAMKSIASDVYDNLVPFSTRKPLSLKTGGGMLASMASRLAPMTRNLELLSIYLGSVTTDSDGQATAKLALPEYSGKGRLMAVAASPKAVGSAEKPVAIAREVTVEATVPRMAAPGDTFTVPVLAFSDGAKAVKAEITVSTEGPLAVSGEQTFNVSLDAASPKAELALAVSALETGGLGVIRVATRIEGADQPPFEQRLEIPVRPPYPRLTRAGSGAVTGGETAAIDIGGGFFPGTQNVSLSIADTPGIGLMRALDYLGHYPYGCLEQTTSAAWPYLAVPAMLKRIDPEKAKDSEFKQAVDYAVRRILSMQRGDGGFNGWPGMRAMPYYSWTSVYAAHFLTEAKSLGVVPQDALQAALSWLRSYLTSQLPEEEHGVMDTLSIKAYACYVLALNGDAPLGWMQFLRDQGKFLTQSARIFLAGAYAAATGKTDALRELGTLPLPKTGRYGWSLESAPRNEALRLLMWASSDPFAPEAALLAKRVIDDGNAGKWRSTQENAMAVLALGRYIEKTSGASGDFSAALRSGETAVATFTNKDAPTLGMKDLPLAEGAPAPLALTVTGEGTAYYTWTTTGVPLAAPAPFAEGISVIRRWVLADGTVYDFIPDATGALPKNLRDLVIPHGAKVTVTLYVKPEAAMTSLVLADIVPGGFEIDNPNLVPDGEYAAQAGTVINPSTNKPFDPPAGFEKAVQLNEFPAIRTEMRDDRLLLFADSPPVKPSAYTYTLRAVSKGAFTLPPVSAEDMYDPSVRALSPGAKVVVE